VTGAIEAGLENRNRPPAGQLGHREEEKLEAILPLMQEIRCTVVAISNDETGISMDPDVASQLPRKLFERRHGFSASRPL